MPSPWTSIRQLRSHPNFDLKGERRQVFSAALEQADRLWQASKDVGPSASPMLRFYAVSQAGRAIAAGLGPKNNGWRANSSHGLKLTPLDTTSTTPTLQDIKVSPSGNGLFQQVSSLLGSPNLPDSVSVADLLLSCPLWDVPTTNNAPGAVRAQWADNIRDFDGSSLFVVPVPAELVDTELVPASPTNLEYRRRIITDEDQLRRWLESFPTLRPFLQNASIGHLQPDELGNPNSEIGISLNWSVGPCAHGYRGAYLDLTTSPSWEHQPYGLLSTAPAGGEAPIAPLMVAWATLYALSMLSRYYPAQWVGMLDVDRSRLAVPLEGIVGPDDEVVPSLLLSAFLNEKPARLRAT